MASHPDPGRCDAGRPGPLILLDGMSLAFRAYFALPDTLRPRRRVSSPTRCTASPPWCSYLIRDHRPVGPGGGLRPARAGRSATRSSTTTRAGGPRRPADLPPQFDMIRDGAGVAGHPGGRGRGLRGRRRAGHPGHRGPRPRPSGSSSSPATATATSWSRTPTSGCSTTGGGSATTPSTTRPASWSADRGAALPVPAAGRAARRPVGQPARRAGGGGEDGGQADQRVRRPRHALRPPRRADAQAARRTWPTNADRVRSNAEVIPLVRDVPLDVDVDRPGARRVGPRGRPGGHVRPTSR